MADGSLPAETAPERPLWIETGRKRTPDPECLGALYQAGPHAVLRSAIVAAIREARDLVCICSFLFSDREIHAALLHAAGNGARVYVLTASREQLERLPKDEERGRERVEEHQRMLDELAGRVLVRCSDRFHAKFVLVDPHAPESTGFLSTANLNPALLRNAELGVKLDQSQVSALFGLFCKAFWSWSDNELRSPGELAPCTTRPFPTPSELPARVCWTTPEKGALGQRVLQMLRESNRKITIAVYSIDPDHEVCRVLRSKAREGVEVTVLIPVRPKLGSAATSLVRDGITVIGVDLLHAKAVLTDHDALVMTANLERRGLDEGFEIGVTCEGELRNALADVLASWEHDAEWRLRPGTVHEAPTGNARDPMTGAFLPRSPRPNEDHARKR